MRRKLKSIVILFLVISTTSTLVIAKPINEKESDNTLQSSLPDLIVNISFIKSQNDEYHYARMTVTNIGYAPAIPEDNFTFKLIAYPFGVYAFYDAIIHILFSLPPPIQMALSIFLVDILHIWPLACMTTAMVYSQPLYPGESVCKTSVFPFDEAPNDFINAKICMIAEAIVDIDDTIEESNEQNNKKVVRWWFPLKNEPPE